MKTLLKISCSPRAERSDSRSLGDYFVEELLIRSPKAWEVDSIDLWDNPLPELDSVVTSAKYAVMMGVPLNEDQKSRWQDIKSHFERFAKADAVVIALPMWNFGVPYILKHYIDVITQPGLCFKLDEEGQYVPLVAPKRCVLANSSAADYALGSGREDNDYCLPYLEKWLRVYFGYEVDSLRFAPTIGPDADVERARKRALADAVLVINSFC